MTNTVKYQHLVLDQETFRAAREAYLAIADQLPAYFRAELVEPLEALFGPAPPRPEEAGSWNGRLTKNSRQVETSED